MVPAAARSRRERDYSDPFADDPDLEDREIISDPLEPVNRRIFAFNDRFYTYVADPVTRGYETVTPRPVRRSIGNFFNNLREPFHFVNSILQGRGDDAHHAFGRFVVNTTFGVGGLIDVAGEHLEQRPRNFNQTLATWGVGDGFYIVLPVAGPSSLRDSSGSLVDSFMHPLYYQEVEVAAAGRTLEGVNTARPYLREYENLKRFALDPYIAVKDVYERTGGVIE